MYSPKNESQKIENNQLKSNQSAEKFIRRLKNFTIAIPKRLNKRYGLVILFW